MEKGIQIIIISIAIIFSSLLIMLSIYEVVFFNMDITKAGDLNSILVDILDSEMHNLMEREVDLGSKTRGVASFKSVMDYLKDSTGLPGQGTAINVEYSYKKGEASSSSNSTSLSLPENKYKHQLEEKINDKLSPYWEAGFLEPYDNGKYVEVEVIELQQPQIHFDSDYDKSHHKIFYNLKRKDGSEDNPDWDVTDDKYFYPSGEEIDSKEGDEDYSDRNIASNYGNSKELPTNLEEELSAGKFPTLTVTATIKQKDITNTDVNLANLSAVSTGKIQHRNLKVITRR